MNSALSAIPIERRRRAAATLGLFAVLCATMGVVSMTGQGTPGAVRVFAGLVLAVATALALVSWGVAHSVRVDVAELRLDKAIDQAIDEIAARGGGSVLSCGCGHDHDMDEMRVEAGHSTPGPACSHDGAGVECAHSCDTCVLNEVLKTLKH